MTVRTARAMTVRREDWPGRLAALLAEAKDRPLDWGRHDCCLFAADAVLAMTGEDPAAALRGRYRDVKGARRIVKARGGSLERLAEAMAKRHGWPECRVLQARRGDLLLLAPAAPISPGWPQAFGICIGAIAAVPGQSRMVFLPLVQAVRAWSI